MSNHQLNEQVDISQKPAIDTANPANKGAQITVGDLHGNALKLLYVLARHGFITISNDDYNDFVTMYRKGADELTQDDINRFNHIVAGIQVNNTGATLRLIGDEFCDRGQNDYFTLKLVDMLHQKGVDMDILLSNHSADFVRAYEQHNDFTQLMLFGGFGISMGNMQELIEKNLVSYDEIIGMINRSYKPNLKAIDYTLSDDSQTITVYTHAGIGIDNIQHLAKQLGVSFNGSNAIELARTIDAMNVRFAQDYAMKGQVHTLLNAQQENLGFSNQVLDQANWPLVHMIWNRDYNGLNRPAFVNFVHGHDSKEATKDNVYNIDNNLGKFNIRKDEQGIYNILYSHESKRPEMAPVASELPSPVLLDDVELASSYFSSSAAAAVDVASAAENAPQLDLSQSMIFDPATLARLLGEDGASLASIQAPVSASPALLSPVNVAPTPSLPSTPASATPALASPARPVNFTHTNPMYTAPSLADSKASVLASTSSVAANPAVAAAPAQSLPSTPVSVAAALASPSLALPTTTPESVTPACASSVVTSQSSDNLLSDAARKLMEVQRASLPQPQLPANWIPSAAPKFSVVPGSGMPKPVELPTTPVSVSPALARPVPATPVRVPTPARPAPALPTTPVSASPALVRPAPATPALTPAPVVPAMGHSVLASGASTGKPDVSRDAQLALELDRALNGRRPTKADKPNVPKHPPVLPRPSKPVPKAVTPALAARTGKAAVKPAAAAAKPAAVARTMTPAEQITLHNKRRSGMA